MREYPNGLKDIKVDVWKYVDEKREELAELNSYDYEVIFNESAFGNELETIEVYSLADDWYSQFGSTYWCGILNLEPWCYVFDNPKYNVGSEECIWAELIEHHLSYDGHSITFKFNKKSQLNGWLCYYSRTGDVATNVGTLFHTTIEHIFEKDGKRRDSSLWTFEPYTWCENCGMPFINDLNECPECKSKLVYA